MSMSRWEETTQWTGRKWKSIKIWTREKSKSKPVRWAISLLSGASLASAMHGFIPMDGAWIAFNIMATGITFAVSARLTSHGLSSQEETPVMIQKLVKNTVKNALKDVIDQLNRNVKIQNNNTNLILKQLNHAHQRAADNAALEPLTITPVLHDVQPLQSIQLTIRIDIADHHAQNTSSSECFSLRDCWLRLRGQERLSFFTQTADTELTRQQLESDHLSTPAPPTMIYSYQTDLQEGMKREFYH